MGKKELRKKHSGRVLSGVHSREHKHNYLSHGIERGFRSQEFCIYKSVVITRFLVVREVISTECSSSIKIDLEGIFKMSNNMLRKTHFQIPTPNTSAKWSLLKAPKLQLQACRRGT
jgi:hypothetical protein